MLNTIYTIHAKLAEQGTTIDNIIALAIALFVLMGVGYLVELRKSEKLGKEGDN